MGTASAELDKQLDELLAEGVEGARRREAATFDDLAGSYASELVLFGAGNLGRRTLAGLRKIGIAPLCFIDNNKARWGETLDGIPILSPEEGARLYRANATFVVTIWRGEGTERMRDRVAQLRQLGCMSVVPFLPLYWKLSDMLLPHYVHDLPHRVHLQAGLVREGFQLMADNLSRREYLTQLRFRLRGDFECLSPPVQGDEYFREDLFNLENDETFVDCGAFDGDTVNLFLNKTGNLFKRVIAFEPDPSNYAQLASRISTIDLELRERITPYRAATGKADERVKMDVGHDLASRIGSGDQEVDCIALDSVLQSVPVSFIKMDIEGSEIDALAGARTLIRKNMPILAICSYHKQDDLWNIPVFINDIAPGYSFHLRPHMLEGWDLVCYAVPGNRRHR